MDKDRTQIKEGFTAGGPKKLFRGNIDIRVDGFSKDSLRIEYVGENKRLTKEKQKVKLPKKRLTKECPYCKEEILRDAIKCKHCGSLLIGKIPAKMIAIRESFRYSFGFRTLGWAAAGCLVVTFALLMILVTLYTVIARFLSRYF